MCVSTSSLYICTIAQYSTVIVLWDIHVKQKTNTYGQAVAWMRLKMNNMIFAIKSKTELASS